MFLLLSFLGLKIQISDDLENIGFYSVLCSTGFGVLKVVKDFQSNFLIDLVLFVIIEHLLISGYVELVLLFVYFAFL